MTDVALGHYVKRLSQGYNYRQAAEGTGYHFDTFGKARRRNPEFGAACAQAVEQSVAMKFVQGGRNRALQLRRNRSTRFTSKRQEAFLSWYAATGNLIESADKAGVSSSTVDKHRRKHPEFERRVQEALGHAYLKLDSELVAGRLAAQRRLLEVEPADEPGPEFDRALKLLQRWDRNRSAGPAAAGGAFEKRWNFDEAITLLEKKLRNMGIPILPLPVGYERPDGDRPLPPSAAGLRGGSEEDEGEGGQ